MALGRRHRRAIPPASRFESVRNARGMAGFQVNPGDGVKMQGLIVLGSASV